MTDVPDPIAAALTRALRQVLAPLAQLALARGVTQATLQELLKQALVEAADAAHAEVPAHRRVSRVSTATGIHRREVTRLLGELRAGRAAEAPPQRSHASELFTRWRTDRAYCDRRGSPRELPRQGPAPSFESLALGLTRDVHPRSLLDELQRLGLAAHDAERDTVRLLRESFVPQGDFARLARVLGNNVGSHLQAAVDNVLGDGRRHFEQALFADGLSDESLAELRDQVQAQWQGLMDTMVPVLQALVDRDEQRAAAEPAAPRHRLRLGLYCHTRPNDDTATPVQATDSKGKTT